MQYLTWSDVTNQLVEQPQVEFLRVDKRAIAHPRDAGMVRSVGLPVGQLLDWRWPSTHCGPVHVREFLTYYTCHLDRANPHCDPVEHLAADTPQLVAGAALGALVGIAFGQSKEAGLVGGLLGALLGAAADARRERLATGASAPTRGRKS
jgi:hypothetical protein